MDQVEAKTSTGVMKIDETCDTKKDSLHVIMLEEYFDEYCKKWLKNNLLRSRQFAETWSQDKTS